MTSTLRDHGGDDREHEVEAGPVDEVAVHGRFPPVRRAGRRESSGSSGSALRSAARFLARAPFLDRAALDRCSSSLRVRRVGELEERRQLALGGIERRWPGPAGPAPRPSRTAIDRSASSIRLTAGSRRMISEPRGAWPAGRTSNSSASPPSVAGPHHGELLEQLVEELDRRRALAGPPAGPGPAQEEPPPLVAAGLQAERRRERDRLLEGLALLGGHLGPGQPGVDQDRQVLLVLLLELLDHQLAAPGRGPPVDPARAVARSGNRAGRDIPPAGPSGRAAGPGGSRSPAAGLEPAPGELADPRIDEDLVGMRDRDAALDQPERRAGAEVEVAEAVLAAAGALRLPADPHPVAAGTRAKKTRGVTLVAPATERSTGTSGPR